MDIVALLTCKAGMNWQIQDSPVHFKADAIGNLGTNHSFSEQKVLYRFDTKAPLVSSFQPLPGGAAS